MPSRFNEYDVPDNLTDIIAKMAQDDRNRERVKAMGARAQAERDAELVERADRARAKRAAGSFGSLADEAALRELERREASDEPLMSHEEAKRIAANIYDDDRSGFDPASAKREREAQAAKDKAGERARINAERARLHLPPLRDGE